MVFEGKYHGHVAPLLALDDRGATMPEYRGIQPDEVRNTVVVPFNDLVAVERSLRQDDVALILSEPAMTNIGLIYPAAGFHDGVAALAKQHDAILAIDETQTQACSRLASEIERPAHPDYLSGAPIDQPALGGTMFANAVSMAACRANLGEVMTAPAYERAASLAGKLAAGLQIIIEKHDLAWSVSQLGTRVWCCHSRELPRNAADVRKCDNPAPRCSPGSR